MFVDTAVQINKEANPKVIASRVPYKPKAQIVVCVKHLLAKKKEKEDLQNQRPLQISDR